MIIDFDVGNKNIYHTGGLFTSTDDGEMDERCSLKETVIPASIWNRRGLSSVSYRIGTFSSFRQSLLDAIPTKPELRTWNYRLKDEHGVALLEMWAYLADIITFYQERIINEAFLSTSKHSDSVRRLAYLVDYKPGNGVASTAMQAFIVDKGKDITIPANLRLQSVPGVGEVPAKFETDEEIKAYSCLNQIDVLPLPKPVSPLSQGCSIARIISSSVLDMLKPTDEIVILEPALNVQSYVHLEELRIISISDWQGKNALSWEPPLRADFSSNAIGFKIKRKAKLYGYDAPCEMRVPSSNGFELSISTYDFTKSASLTKTENYPTFTLDKLYEDLLPGSTLLVVYRVSGKAFTCRCSVVNVYQVEAKIKFGTFTTLSSSVVTNVIVIPIDKTPVSRLNGLDSRYTVIYELDGSTFKFWNKTFPDDISSPNIYIPKGEIDKSFSEALSILSPGRTVILQDVNGTSVTASISPGMTDLDGYFKLELEAKSSTWPALTMPVVLFGNVSKVSHGESISKEVLGDGDASAKFQSFTLKKYPLTHILDPGTSRGSASTLLVFVDNIRWREVPSFYNCSPYDHVYIVQEDEAGQAKIRFGNGIRGSRLPTGVKNVIAYYRQGIGISGDIKAQSLTVLLDRPDGLKKGMNPSDASGGAEPERGCEIQKNAPNCVRTLGRIVSLRDYEDACRQYAGVSKAKAYWTLKNGNRSICISVSGQCGSKIDPLGLGTLTAHLNVLRDARFVMSVDNLVHIYLTCEVQVKIKSDFLSSIVIEDVRKIVRDLFSYDRREPGQNVAASDVYMEVQGVSGVVSLKVVRLGFLDSSLETGRVRGNKSGSSSYVADLTIRSNEIAYVSNPSTDIIVSEAEF